MRTLNRRTFLGTATAGVTLAVALPAQQKDSTMIGVPFERRDPPNIVRIAIVGVGLRGNSHIRNLLAVDNVQITAVCDIVPAKVAAAQARVQKAGQKQPAGYSAGERDFENLCRRDDIDLVYCATSWDWHMPVAVAAMKNGKHSGVEVPAANTLAECWELVDTSEKTRRHCIMLENACYGYNELMVLNMVRAGLFGDLTHGECAYIHDLRRILTEDRNEGLWRRIPHTKEDSNLYPTHGLGPVSRYLDINRGDRFETLVSMSSRERSLTEYVRATYPEGNPKPQERYVTGDMNTSLLRTANGRTVVLQHDVVSPRPYDRINMISGTKGAFRDFPARIFLDGQKDHNDWQSVDPFKDQYEHRLWKTQGELARKTGGHGGKDFMMSYRLVECFRQGLVPDMDVYDAAAWSAPRPLSATSVAKGSEPQKFPDFTRGKWSGRRQQAV